MTLEVCVDTVEGARIAWEAGADRVELSAVLQVGGVTPSRALIQATRRAIPIPLVVLIRSRPGDFEYQPDEYRLMFEEAKQAIDEGADGIVVGGLEDKALYRPFLEALADLRQQQFNAAWELVVHRAFDVVNDPVSELEYLCEVGFDRILTSSGPLHAIDGLVGLQRLQDKASGRIEILPAGGVDSNNALTILEATRCTQLHGSFKRVATQAYPLPDPARIAAVKKTLVEYLHRASGQLG
jgi:copper homeostasis protein